MKKMNMRFALLALALGFSSCNKTNLKVGDAYIAKDDSVCLKEYFEAEKQFKQGEIYYCEFNKGMHFASQNAIRVYSEEFKKLGIELRFEAASDLPKENKIDNCGCKYMKDRIFDKYGKSVIDSIQSVVRKKMEL